MIVVDAGVLAAHLNEKDAFHAATGAFFEEFEEFDFGSNVVTVAECLVLPVESAPRVADIRAHARLKMPGAIVLYTAERAGSDLVTTDAALARAAEARGVTAHLLSAG